MTREKKSTSRHFRKAKAAASMLLLYAILCVTYIHLPDRAREPVWKNARGLNRQLCLHGNAICNVIEDLGLWGHDQSIVLDRHYNDAQVYAGWPKQKLTALHRVTRLANSGFTVGYSEHHEIPLWVAYRIFDVPKLESGKRPSGFNTDPRTKAKVSHSDYTHSGFDRGHMAPNYAIATRYGRAAQKETFLMSNIIPQTPAVNRNIWKDLEMTVAKKYGRYFGEVWVITGPIFNRFPDRLASGVTIPDSYYKIIVGEAQGELRALAFIIDKDCPPYTRLKSHLVSIDEIEQKTGLNFLSELPDDKEDQLEALPAKRLWPTLASALRYHLGYKPQRSTD